MHSKVFPCSNQQFRACIGLCWCAKARAMIWVYQGSQHGLPECLDFTNVHEISTHLTALRWYLYLSIFFSSIYLAISYSAIYLLHRKGHWHHDMRQVHVYAHLTCDVYCFSSIESTAFGRQKYIRHNQCLHGIESSIALTVEIATRYWLIYFIRQSQDTSSLLRHPDS